MKKFFRLAILMVICAGLQTAPALGATAADFKQDMRKLWTDHVVWTRDYIIAAVGDQPDAAAAAARLMKNQEAIGAAVATFYGAPAGQQLTTLLKEHINNRRRPDQGCEGREQSRTAASRHPLAGERRQDRRFPQQGQSQLAAGDSCRLDEDAPVDDDQ